MPVSQLAMYSSTYILTPGQVAPQPQIKALSNHHAKRKCTDETRPAPVDYLAYTLKRRILDAFAQEHLAAGGGSWRHLPDHVLPLKKRRCFRTVVTTVTEVECDGGRE